MRNKVKLYIELRDIKNTKKIDKQPNDLNKIEKLDKTKSTKNTTVSKDKLRQKLKYRKKNK